MRRLINMLWTLVGILLVLGAATAVVKYHAVIFFGQPEFWRLSLETALPAGFGSAVIAGVRKYKVRWTLAALQFAAVAVLVGSIVPPAFHFTVFSAVLFDVAIGGLAGVVGVLVVKLRTVHYFRVGVISHEVKELRISAVTKNVEVRLGGGPEIGVWSEKSGRWLVTSDGCVRQVGNNRRVHMQVYPSKTFCGTVWLNGKRVNWLGEALANCNQRKS